MIAINRKPLLLLTGTGVSKYSMRPNNGRVGVSRIRAANRRM
jgi:hypothetical protein